MPKEKSKNYKFHFIAIGGVGQSALAEILLKLGYEVQGSDLKESKYTKLVQSLGAKVFIGQDGNNLKGDETVVISTAIKQDNPELIKAKKLNLQIMHRSDCLKFISELFEIFIGTSGTHGKTTTSGLLSYVLQNLNQNPSYAIGGIIPQFNTNAKGDKNSKYFIAELDESDKTIVKYNPNYLVINNIEADHLDHYKDIDEIIDTFKKAYLNTLDKVFINVDNDGCNRLIKENNFNNFISYGINGDAIYKAKNIKFDENNSSFDVYKKDNLLGSINLIIPGLYNVYNALSIIAVLDYLGFDLKDYKPYFKSFTGMGRRFQQVSDNNNIKIIDDYAHHPTEIKATLSALDNFKRRKIVIFQPHRYTRLKALWAEFLEVFKNSNVDYIYALDVFCAGDEYDETFNSKTFIDELKKFKANVKYIKGDMTEASKTIAPEIKSGDMVLTIGAGDVTKIGGMINDLLAK